MTRVSLYAVAAALMVGTAVLMGGLWVFGASAVPAGTVYAPLDPEAEMLPGVETPWAIEPHHTPPPGVPPGPPDVRGPHGHGGGPTGATLEALEARAVANVGADMAAGLVRYAELEAARRAAGTDVRIGR